MIDRRKGRRSISDGRSSAPYQFSGLASDDAGIALVKSIPQGRQRSFINPHPRELMGEKALHWVRSIHFFHVSMFFGWFCFAFSNFFVWIVEAIDFGDGYNSSGKCELRLTLVKVLFAWLQTRCL